MVAAAEALGLTRRIAERELDRMVEGLPRQLAALVQQVEDENAHYPPSVRAQLGGELRLLRTIQHLIAPEMSARVTA